MQLTLYYWLPTTNYTVKFPWMILSSSRRSRDLFYAPVVSTGGAKTTTHRKSSVSSVHFIRAATRVTLITSTVPRSDGTYMCSHDFHHPDTFTQGNDAAC